jgi:seryl-tRNA synthetase
MSTTAVQEDLSLAADTFAALEQRVVRTIEMLRAERQLRMAAEKQLERAKEEMDLHALEVENLRSQLAALNQERDAVRQRVERLLANLDAIATP